MKKHLFWLVLSVAACGQNLSSPDTQNFGPQGSFQVSQQLPASDMSRYGIGCITAGSYSPRAQIDPRLRVGLTYESFIHSISTKTGEMVLGARSQIQSLGAQSVVTFHTATQALGIPGASVGMTATSTCTLDNQGHYTCGSNSQLPNLNLSSDCSIPSPKNSEGPIQYRGFYTLGNKVVLSAYKITFRADGDVVCSGNNLGLGKMESILIVSNEFPAVDSADYCGGVPIFSSTRFTKADGAGISAATVERTSLK